MCKGLPAVTLFNSVDILNTYSEPGTLLAAVDTKMAMIHLGVPGSMVQLGPLMKLELLI